MKRNTVHVSDVDSMEIDYSQSVLEDGFRAQYFFRKENTTRMNIGQQKLNARREQKLGAGEDNLKGITNHLSQMSH